MRRVTSVTKRIISIKGENEENENEIILLPRPSDPTFGLIVS